ncbi:MAG: ABC transporter ATP-binding protein [Arachnia sp.]
MTDSSPTASLVVAMHDFSFSYDGSGAWQLSNVTIDLVKGERLAIMGATGAGKSTLAMALNGLVPHHHEGQVSGEVVVEGLRTVDHSNVDIVRKVGLVMQDPETQITGQTAVTDAAVGPANFGLPREVVMERATRSLELVGLGDLADRDTHSFSGGQKQRLVVAGVLAMDSGILVLDEPTSELDPLGTAELFALVRRLSADADKTIVLIEHEAELIADWAHRLVVLDGGRVVYDGPPVDFFKNASAVASAGLRAPHVTQAALALAAEGRFSGPIPISLQNARVCLEPWRDRGVAQSPVETAPSGRAVIETVSLGHVYRSGVDALVDVSVTITEGEFVAVLGENGAGKTTFARHLNGLLRPTSGKLFINGESAANRPVSDLARHVGYVFQNPDHQIFANSVRDEVAYGLKNLGWKPDCIRQRVDAVLDQVGMHNVASRHPFTLGKGQRQRLAVASVLALAPRVLVIDEPTTGQDWLGAESMMSLVRELNGAGTTIVMITHDMGIVAAYAKRALVFASGHLVADTSPASLFGDTELLERSMLLAPQITSLAATLGCPRVVTTLCQFRREWGLGGDHAV